MKRYFTYIIVFFTIVAFCFTYFIWKGTYSNESIDDLFSFEYSLYVDYDNNKIVNIVDGTKVLDIVSKVIIPDGAKLDVKVMNKNNEIKSSNDLVFTGDSLLINNKYKYDLSVMGDANGDGIVDLVDLVQIRKQIVGWIDTNTNQIYNKVGVYYDAIDFNDDDSVDLIDLVRMRKRIVDLRNVYFVKLSKEKLNLYIDDSHQLEYSIIYDVNSASVTWKSSDTDIVTVDSTGKITAVGVGNAIITATTVNGISASCEVSVSGSGYDRIHFISNGDAFSTFVSSGVVNGQNNGPSPSEVILLESQGKFALIDSGLHNDHGDSLNEGRTDYVMEYLNKVGVKELEFMLITHVHYDHMGGATTIIKNIKTKKLYAKPFYGDESSNNGKRWATLYSEAHTKQNIYQKINASWENKQLDLGNMDLFLYNTTNLQYYQECSDEDENINSIMTYITVNGRKIFLTGDMEKPSSSACKGVYKGTCDVSSKTCSTLGCTKSSVTACIVSDYGIKNLDLFKLPHHGYGSCDVDGITMKSDGALVATNWEDKVAYYYSGITVNGKKVGPVYSSSSCRAKYFSGYTTENKRLYYVGNNNLIFDFTNGGKKIYNN